LSLADLLWMSWYRAGVLQFGFEEPSNLMHRRNDLVEVADEIGLSQGKLRP
jgi:hypothetical protein